MAIPYVRPAYDNNQSRARMSDLMRLRAENEADAIRQQGQNSANAWANMGQIAATAVSNVGQAIGDIPKQRAMAAQTERVKRETDAANSIDAIRKQYGNQSPTQLAEALEAAGHVDAGAETRMKALQLSRLQTEQAEFNTNKAISLVNGVGNLPTADQPSAYAKVVETIRTKGMMPPEAIALLPREYDQPTVDRLVASAAPLSHQLAVEKEARLALESRIKANDEAVKNENDRIRYTNERNKAALETGARLISVSKNQADLDRAISTMRDIGASDATMSAFPSKWDANTPSVAKDFLTADKVKAQPHTAGSSGSSQGAEGRDAGAISQPQRAAAISSKVSTLKELEKEFVKANEADNPEWRSGRDAPTPASQAALEYGKLQAENVYREKFGLPPISNLSEAGYGPMAKPMSDLAKPEGAATAPTMTAPAQPVGLPQNRPSVPQTQTAPPQAPPAGRGVPMTEMRATAILREAIGRSPTPTEIAKFMRKYPVEQQ